MIKGGVRHADHEYAFQAGADVESLGRKPLEIEFQSLFCDSLLKYGTQLYPLTLGQLQRAFEKEERGSLLVPGLGTIRALCTDWTRNMSGKYMNGEMVSMQFIEVSANEFSTENLVQIQSTSFSDMALAFKQFQGRITSNPSIFDQIQDLADQVQAIMDAPGIAFAILEAKIEQLKKILERADSSLQELQDPENYDLSGSLRDLWYATKNLGETIFGITKITLFKPPVRMTLQQISYSIFGDSSKVSELLDLNPIEDVMDIAPGTPIKYFATGST